MSVLLYCNDPKEHAKFLETMMRFKKNVCLDLLAVMAYGPSEVLQPSVQLLFHYYPSIDVGEYAGHYCMSWKLNNTVTGSSHGDPGTPER